MTEEWVGFVGGLILIVALVAPVLVVAAVGTALLAL